VAKRAAVIFTRLCLLQQALFGILRPLTNIAEGDFQPVDPAA
jgi:hypothetical protein